MERACILVVDDDRPIVRLLEIVLNNNGYRTILAADGEEALQLIGAQTPAAVVLDLNIPKKPGWEVYQEIKSRWNIPVIVISGNVLLGERIREHLKKDDVYFSKPFDVLAIVSQIQAATAAS